jgi:hypothetical protein
MYTRKRKEEGVVDRIAFGKMYMNQLYINTPIIWGLDPAMLTLFRCDKREINKIGS